MVPNFVTGTKFIKKKTTEKSPEIGNFVHHIGSGDHTLFNFLKSVINVTGSSDMGDQSSKLGQSYGILR